MDSGFRARAIVFNTPVTLTRSGVLPSRFPCRPARS